MDVYIINPYSPAFVGDGYPDYLWTPMSLSPIPEVWNNDACSYLDAGAGQVERWYNMGTYNTYWVVGGGMNCPDMQAAGLDGKRTTKFNGTDDALYDNNLSQLWNNASGGWVIFVYKKTALDGAPANKFLMANFNGAGTQRLSLRAGDATTANYVRMVVSRTDADAATSFLGTTSPGTSWNSRMAIMDWSGGDAYMYLNGAADGTSLNITSSGNTDSTDSSAFPVLGAFNNGGSLSGDVELAEVMMGRTIPSQSEREQIEGYLHHKWGLEADLDASHPYKLYPPGITYTETLGSLLLFNGTNGSTTFTDVTGKSWTANGNAQLSTTDPKHGTACLLLDGTGDSIQTAASADFNLMSSLAFTVEMWIKPDNISPGNNQVIYSNEHHSFYVTTSGKLRALVNASIGSPWIDLTSTASLSTADYQHIMLSWDGVTARLGIDGTIDQTDTSVVGQIASTASSVLYIGAAASMIGLDAFDGRIDDFRISNKHCFYTGAYTPPGELPTS